MSTALDRYRPVCPLRQDMRRTWRTESLMLADGATVWNRQTVWTTYGAVAPRRYAGVSDDMPIPLSLRQGRWIPADGFAPKPAAIQPRGANRRERSYNGHDSAYDAARERFRNAREKRIGFANPGTMSGADFLGDGD